VLEALTAVRAGFYQRIADADGVDPRRVRARYAPGIGMAKVCILSSGQRIILAAVHEQRRRWLAERVVSAAGFPRR
jgi:hypothetical protein